MLPTPSPFVCARLWWSDPYKVLWEAHHANGAFLQQAEFSGFQGRLRPVAHTQLAQDVAEVILDGAAGDVERLADLAIGSATRQQGQDLPLALGKLRHVAHTDERRSGGSDHCGLDGCRGERGNDFVCDVWMQEDLTLCDHANGRGELLGGDVFEHIAQGSRLQTRLDQLALVEGRQDDHADLRPALDDGTRRGNAIQTRHAHIHQHHIGGRSRGREAFNHGQRFLAIPSHADHLQVRLQLNQLAKALAQQALVIHNQHTETLCHGYTFSLVPRAPVVMPSACPRSLSGSTTSTRQPCPGWGPARSVPSSSATRSPMPRRPKPDALCSCEASHPWPLSSTVSSTCPPCSSPVERRSSTLVACACLRILVSASCAQR